MSREEGYLSLREGEVGWAIRKYYFYMGFNLSRWLLGFSFLHSRWEKLFEFSLGPFYVGIAT